MQSESNPQEVKEEIKQMEKWEILNILNECESGIEITYPNNKKEVYFDKEIGIIINEIYENFVNAYAYILPNQLYANKITVNLYNIGKILIEII